MNKYISKTLVFTLLSIYTFTLNFFGISPVQAEQLNLGNSEDSSINIVIKESDENLNDSVTNSVPDLGDDQAFPFIPGFGKNSGKD
tara:strand:- start:219 stop:476 length:258 start_codon:yes stop_codon:yes gene_type:complete